MNRSKFAATFVWVAGLAIAATLSACTGSQCNSPSRMIGAACVMPCPSGYCFADGATADVVADVAADLSDVPGEAGPVDAISDVQDAQDTSTCTSTTTDPSNCGACGHVCPSATNAVATCAGGACGLSCNGGFHLCGGVCADNHSTLSCGTMCSPCSQPPANAIASCDGTTCGYTCIAGFTAMSGTCVALGAPRPVAPLSTSTVTSRQPVFHWVLATGSDGGHVQVCRDRTCATIVTEFDATGVSGAPATNLPTGVLFWHVQSRMGSTTASAASPVWQFRVGARSAAVNGSWGSTLDANGDGFADIAIGAPFGNGGAGHAYVYPGSSPWIVGAPATLPGSDANGGLGKSVASAGDVDGDGFADLVVGAYGANSNSGRAYIYPGGGTSSTGLSATPTGLLSGVDANGYFGEAAASAGDVNGDGYADVIIGAFGADRAYVYLGSGTGLVTSTRVALAGPDGAGSEFGASVASAGDVNGDGFADVVVGAPFASGNAGSAYVYLGGPGGLAVATPIRLSGPDGPNAYFGFSVACAGDVNGDGLADIVVGAYGVGSHAGRAYVFLGGATGPVTATPIPLSGPDGLGGYFGYSVAGAGDVDGDGFADVVVGARNAASAAGHAYVFRGAASGPLSATPAQLSGMDGAGAYLGTSVSGGDVNGDGFTDILVGASGASSSVGRAYVFFGATGGVSTTPSAPLSGVDSTGEFGDAVGLGN